MLADLVHRHDVGVRKTSERLGLTEQPLTAARGVDFARDELERDATVEAIVVRGVLG